MPDATDPADSESQEALRLHPLSLIFTIGGVARSFLLPALFVIFTSGAKAELMFAAFFLPGAIYAVLHYLTFSYRFRPEELVVRGGILVRYERHVPYPRIQNIDLVQNPLHRLLKVAQVSIETAGGKEPEAVMKVLSLEAVETLRERVYAERALAQPESGPGGVGHAASIEEDSDGVSLAGASPTESGAASHRLLYRLGTPDLLLMGLLSNRGLAIVAAIWGLAAQSETTAERIVKEAITNADGYLEEGGSLTQQFESLGLGMQIATGLGIFLAFFLTLKILSVLWVILRFHGFRLERAGEDLRISFGLLTRLSATVPRRRIQVLGVHASLLQRRLKRVAFRAQTAGAAEDGEDSTSSSRAFLAPLIRREECRSLIEEVQPGVLDVNREPEWRPADFSAWSRVVKPRLLVAMILTGLLMLRYGWPGLALLFPTAAFSIVSARGWMKRLAYALEPDALLLRRGWWRHELGIIPHSRIQAVSLSRSPFDRRWGMATLHVDAAGRGGARVHTSIPYLPEEEAEQLMEKLHREAVARPFVWG